MTSEQYPKFDFKNITWEEYVLFFSILLSVIIYSVHISQFTQLPSPIYGGDYYRDRGFIQNIVSGNPLWSDGFYVNEIQYYSYGVFVLQAYFVKLTGASVDSVFLYTPIVFLILSSFVWYLSGLRIFKNKRLALLTSIAFIGLVFSYYPKSANVAVTFTIPLFIYFWLKYEQENRNIDAILAGLMIGITSLVWGGIFLGMFATFGGAICYYFIKNIISDYKTHKFSNLHNTTLAFLKRYYLIFVIAILVSMVFFLPLILKYHLIEYNYVTKWGDGKIENHGPSWIFNILKLVFFNTKNFVTILVSLIAFLGLVGMFLSKKKLEAEFFLVILISNILILQHHLLTRPLLNWWFLPSKMEYVYYLSPVFFVFGILFLYSIFKKEIFKRAIFVIAIILLALHFHFIYDRMVNLDVWDKAGRSDPTYTNSLYALGDFLENNMALNETVLSNDESGFMLAVTSGRKVMITRRTHASYYVDIDKRIAQASVAMYGNDINETKRILKEYNVKYFYLDAQLMSYPMRTRTDLAGYLTQYDVKFFEAYDRYDIAVPVEQANAMNLLIIPPQNITKEFMGLLEKAYVVQVQGQVVGELYLVKQ